MIPAFFSSARMILLECRESLAGQNASIVFFNFVYVPMVVWYTCKRIGLMINNNDIKEPSRGFQNYYTNHILIIGGYVKMRECLHTQVIIGVNTILKAPPPLDHSVIVRT